MLKEWRPGVSSGLAYGEIHGSSRGSREQKKELAEGGGGCRAVTPHRPSTNHGQKGKRFRKAIRRKGSRGSQQAAAMRRGRRKRRNAVY